MIFDARAWARLLTLCVALLFEGMSLSSINVQLAGIQRELALPNDQLQLVASAFLTTYAGLLLVGGRWADHWGARRLFMIGVATFGLASLGAALADDAVQLIAARAVAGCGAAITAPAAVALIIREFPVGRARNRALGVLSAMGAAGFTLGVVVGGAVTDLAGWRAGFILFVPFSVLVLLVTPRLIGRTPRGSGTVGWASAAVVTTGLIVLVYAIGRVGVASAIEIGAAAIIGLTLCAIFVVLQARARHPLVPRALLTNRRMAAACVALGGSFAAITGAMFLVGTGLQEHHGYSPLAAGMAFLPQGLAVGLLSPAAVRLVGRWSADRLLLTGLGVVACGQLLYTTALGTDYLWHLLPACLLVGLGIAAMYPAATMIASSVAPPDQQGTASGVLTTCQQAGGALGVAMVAAVNSATNAELGANPAGLVAAAIVAVVSAAVCAGLTLRRSASRV